MGWCDAFLVVARLLTVAIVMVRWNLMLTDAVEKLAARQNP